MLYLQRNLQSLFSQNFSRELGSGSVSQRCICVHARRWGPLGVLLNVLEYAITHVQLYSYCVGSELIIIDTGTHPIFTFFFLLVEDCSSFFFLFFQMWCSLFFMLISCLYWYSTLITTFNPVSVSWIRTLMLDLRLP